MNTNDLIVLASRMFGGDQVKVTLWLNAHNYHLDGVPAQLMRDEAGRRRVVRYVETMLGGLNGDNG